MENYKLSAKLAKANVTIGELKEDLEDLWAALVCSVGPGPETTRALLVNRSQPEHKWTGQSYEVNLEDLERCETRRTLLKKDGPNHNEYENVRDNIIHAEMDLLLKFIQTPRDLKSTDLFYLAVSKFPCYNCALDLVRHLPKLAGVMAPTLNPKSSWYKSQKRAKAFLLDRGVAVQTKQWQYNLTRLETNMTNGSSHLNNLNFKFNVGAQVDKVKGYSFHGEVRARFTTRAGKQRYVVESTVPGAEGMLHIYNEGNLKLSTLNHEES